MQGTTTDRTGKDGRRLILVLAALLCSGAVLAAPPGGAHRSGPGGPDPERMLAHMTTALDLRAEQQEAVREALEARRTELRTVHEEMRATHREMRNLDPAAADYSERADALARRQGELTTRMAGLRAETRAEVMAVLDEEQKAEFAAMHAERAERMQERREKLREFHQERQGKAKGEVGRGPAAADLSDTEFGATEDSIL